MSEAVEGAVALTADLCARAVIAAAQAYGDDPVQACLAAGTAQVRRSLGAAVSGLARATDLPIPRVAGVFGLRPQTIHQARHKKRGDFLRAELAALRAAEFAMWRPEAAESVAPEVEAAAPPAETPAAPPELATAPEPAPAPAPVASPADTLEKLRVAVRAQPKPAPREIPPPQAAQPRRAGAISADLSPPRFAKAPAVGERLITDLVLEALAGGPRDSLNIASVIDRKEMAVVSALSQLKSERKVADEEYAGGARRYRWRLVA